MTPTPAPARARTTSKVNDAVNVNPVTSIWTKRMNSDVRLVSATDTRPNVNRLMATRVIRSNRCLRRAMSVGER